MNTRLHCFLTSTLVASSIQAATITATGNNPSGGQGYAYNVALDSSNNDTTTFNGTVGSWSWEDSTLPGDDTFWRHQSDWIAITLTAHAILTIQVQRNDPNADIKLFPSFTVFRGFNDTTEGPHFASNISDLRWEPTSQLLEYVGHHDNSTLGAIDEKMTLTAGDYTILLGGNAVAEGSAVNTNYLMTLEAKTIPEPSSSLHGILASMMFLTRRKRRR